MEIIIYDTVLSDSQVKAVEGYLACKWGLQANLPATHPYAKTCPTADSGKPTSALSKYKLYQGKDAAGLDIACFGASSVDEVLNRCEGDPKCVGFITATTPQNKLTFGCTKYGINNAGLGQMYNANQTFKTVDSYVKM